MAEDKSWNERVQEALAKGQPLPGFPSISPLESLGMAMHETVTAFTKVGFERGEAVYLAAAMFNGNPGQSPALGSGSGSTED